MSETAHMHCYFSEALGAFKAQIDSVNGEEVMEEAYTRTLHDLGRLEKLRDKLGCFDVKLLLF